MSCQYSEGGLIEKALKNLKTASLYLLCPLSILKILSVRVNFAIEMSRNLCFDRLSRTIENTDFRYKRVLDTSRFGVTLELTV